jgi:hypothetical protein
MRMQPNQPHQPFDNEADVYVYDAVENLAAYQLTHREMHIACTFAHPTITGLSIVHSTWVNIFIPIAPLYYRKTK